MLGARDELPPDPEEKWELGDSDQTTRGDGRTRGGPAERSGSGAHGAIFTFITTHQITSTVTTGLSFRLCIAVSLVWSFSQYSNTFAYANSCLSA
jgi:hypothetical protein